MSIDPSMRITNQVNPTQQANSNGGGLGGGSSSSYKKDKEEQSLLKENEGEDKFVSSENTEVNIEEEFVNKSLGALFKEFIAAMFNEILLFLRLKRNNNNNDNEEDK